MKIQAVAPSSRPRERLARYGVAQLRDKELVAILIGSGRRGNDVLQLAESLVRQYKTEDLALLTVKELRKIPGIGSAKACSIAAAFELGRRAHLHQETEIRISEPREAFELVRDLEFPRVDLVFDRLGFWPRPRIVYLGCRVVPDTLRRFDRRLRRRLAGIGLVTERRAFSPHITLLRNATRRPRLKLTPLQWSLDGLCGVSSVLEPAGARYAVLQQSPGTSIVSVDGEYM